MVRGEDEAGVRLRGKVEKILHKGSKPIIKWSS